MIDLSLSDDALVSGVRAGDPSAFDTLYSRYRVELVRHAERVLAGRGALAEDVVQESLWRAHRAIAGSEGDIVLRPWLHSIVRNRAIDELRRREAVSLEDTAPLVAGEDLHELAEMREGVQEVLADVVALPARQRDAVVRHILGGEGHVEVARHLGVSVGASKSLLNRARMTLVRAHQERLAA